MEENKETISCLEILRSIISFHWWLGLLTKIIWDYPRLSKIWALINLFYFAPLHVYDAIEHWGWGHTYYRAGAEVSVGILIFAVLRLAPTRKVNDSPG
jgi:hypothetical protein